MKFALKYPNVPFYNDKGISEGVIKDERYRPCAVCGDSTDFTEPFHDAWVCSQECLCELYKNTYPRESARISAIIKADNIAEDFEKPDKPAEKQPPVPSKIVLVEPGKAARITEMELTLENMQQTVGGLIQAIYPWKDKVALVCNDEGKILDLPLNRALADENGSIYDIVAGTFFICGLSEENFTSLTDKQAVSYLEKFRDIHKFVRGADGKIRVLVVHKAEDGNG